MNLTIRLSICLLLILISSDIFAQNDRFNISSSISFQGTDERIFGLNSTWTEEILRINNDKILPSLFFDVGISYDLISKKRFTLNIGLKYAYEWNNSYRTYEHCLIQGDFCKKIGLFIDGYGYHMSGVHLGFDYKFPVKKGIDLILGIEFSSMFRFLSYYDSTFKYYWKVDYMFSEISPKIGFQQNGNEIGLFGRVFQHRKVDEIIYPTESGSGHPVLLDNYTNINPWKIGVYYKHRLSFKNSSTKVENIEKKLEKDKNNRR